MAKNTDQTKKELLEAMVKSLGVVTKACEIAGYHRSTYYEHYNTDPDFAEACDECQDIALDFAESQLHKRISQGGDAAIIFYLKTKGRKRGYIERTEMGIDTNTIEIVPTLPPHED